MPIDVSIDFLLNTRKMMKIIKKYFEAKFLLSQIIPFKMCKKLGSAQSYINHSGGRRGKTVYFPASK